MIKHKNKIIFCSIVAAILVVSFFWGNTPTTQKGNQADGNPVGSDLSAEEKIAAAEEIAKNTLPEQNNEPNFENNVPQNTEPEEKTQISEDTSEKTEEQPQTPPTENNVPDDGKTTCSITVRCDSVLNNMHILAENKKSIIPQNGIIFENKQAEFYDGETVFNVLVRELKKNKIHFEYEKTPLYNSAYIEGIGNLYEFDCGDLSGWLYKVNGKTPGAGCSQYVLSDGDVVEFIYSCNMGIDVGGYKDIKGE